jgi:N-acetylmuramoyl-L-alanine amidase
MILRDELVKQAAANGQTIKVVLMRTTDVNLGIAERVRFAAKEKARAFLCLHFNGLKDKTVNGAETYYRAAQNGNLNLQDDIDFAKAVHEGLMTGMLAVNRQGPPCQTKYRVGSRVASLMTQNSAVLRLTRCVGLYRG